MERGIEKSKQGDASGISRESSVGEILYVLEKFTGEFKSIRGRISDMDDDELVALYQQAKDISNVAWLIRAIVIGTAKERAIRGDGTVASIANQFGIGVRMAEMDIQIYEAFIKDNPEFEPELPAAFYHAAIKAAEPAKAIDFAMEQRLQNPGWPASEFSRYVRGLMQKEPAPKGWFLLTPINGGEMKLMKMDEEETELHAKISLVSIGGSIYAEIK